MMARTGERYLNDDNCLQIDAAGQLGCWAVGLCNNYLGCVVMQNEELRQVKIFGLFVYFLDQCIT